MSSCWKWARFRTKSLLSRHSENRPSPNPVRSMRFSQSLGMIWSVSTSERSSGTARPTISVIFSITPALLSRSLEVSGGGEVAGDRGRGGDLGRHQVGAAAPALASLEVAVRRGGAALTGCELVGVHRQAHGATG